MGGVNEAAANIARISQLIDDANAHRDPEARTWSSPPSSVSPVRTHARA
jgi:hypothetical protein